MRQSRLRRLASAVLITAGLVLLAFTHHRHGLAAQSDRLMLSILPLLFSGLLLGRTGLWCTAVVHFSIMGLGAWTDLQRLPPWLGGQHVLSELLHPVLAGLIVALILDRLIMKSEASERRSRELALICGRLETEIREHRRSQQQLLHSQRIDALGKLASNVAHDFNNLLTVILGYARQGASRPDPAEATRERFEWIADAARRGSDLTGKLLTLARSDRTLRETFDANQALAGLLPMLRSMAGREIAVEASLSPQPAWVHMDRAEFEAGVLNIAKNAIDAMPDGGRFVLSTQLAGTRVVAVLADSGHGMPAETRARIFEPFFTTKPRERGSGIGLAMVHRIVTEAGGGIDCESVPGQGTRFTVTLPLQPAPGDDPAAVDATDPAQDSSRPSAGAPRTLASSAS